MDKVQEEVKVKGSLYNTSVRSNRAKEECKRNKARGKRNEATEKDNKLNDGMRIKAQKKGRRQLGVLYFRVDLCTPYTSLCLVVPSQESHACECFSVNYGLGGAPRVGTSMYMRLSTPPQILRDGLGTLGATTLGRTLRPSNFASISAGCKGEAWYDTAETRSHCTLQVPAPTLK